MAASEYRKIFKFATQQYSSFLRFKGLHLRQRSTSLDTEPKVEIIEKNQDDNPSERKTTIPDSYRFKYPEFLPNPTVEFRNVVCEKLERIDMLNRRRHLDIPEFYVGSILAVTTSDSHATGKTNRFVGICIQRAGTGLRSTFMLRNVIDHQGVDYDYHLYSPIVQKIEVLRLEKRLDTHLLYLRDCPLEYSTFPLDMEPEFHPEGSPVPINTIKIQLNPRPWRARYELMNLQGAILVGLKEKMIKRAAKSATPWLKYDLMDYYRKTIPDEEQKEIYSEVYTQLQEIDLKRKRTRRKRGFQGQK